MYLYHSLPTICPIITFKKLIELSPLLSDFCESLCLKYKVQKLKLGEQLCVPTSELMIEMGPDQTRPKLTFDLQ